MSVELQRGHERRCEKRVLYENNEGPSDEGRMVLPHEACAENGAKDGHMFLRGATGYALEM